MADRYDVSSLAEAQYEPGSSDEVLKNLLGITNSEEMDHAEARALAIATDTLIHEYDEEYEFSPGDIRHMHQLWLGDIYEWAGQYRQVNISKGEFSFAMANRVPDLMEQFGNDQLSTYTPCKGMERAEIIKALAEVHVEFELIHPFREGNGRVGRILTTLMALQAGLPLLNYDIFVEEKKAEYFSAIQSGLDRNYAPMEQLFTRIVENSLASS